MPEAGESVLFCLRFLLGIYRGCTPNFSISIRARRTRRRARLKVQVRCNPLERPRFFVDRRRENPFSPASYFFFGIYRGCTLNFSISIRAPCSTP